MYSNAQLNIKTQLNVKTQLQNIFTRPERFPSGRTTSWARHDRAAPFAGGGSSWEGAKASFRLARWLEGQCGRNRREACCGRR